MGHRRKSHVVVHLNHHAARAEQQERPQLVVVGYAYDGLHAAGHHLLHYHAVNPRVGVVCAGIGDNLGKCRPHRVAVCQTQPDAAGLRLVQYVRRVHLDGNRIPDPLRRCHRRVRIGRNLIPRRRHPKRRHQRLAVKLGKRAAG